MERYNGVEPDPEGAFVYYDDAQRALDAERERLKVQIDYSIQLQRLIESLMYDDTPSPDLYPHTIIVDFKRQLATLQAQLRQVEGERDHAKKMEAVQKEVADNQTWHVQKLKDWRDTVTLALQRPGGARFEDVPEHIKGLVRERDALSIWVNALRDSYDDLESRHADMLGDLTTLTRPTPRRNAMSEQNEVVIRKVHDGYLVELLDCPLAYTFTSQDEAERFIGPVWQRLDYVKDLHSQALRDECERLRKALEVAGDDICSEFCGSGPCHKKCLAVQAALQPEKERHE